MTTLAPYAKAAVAVLGAVLVTVLAQFPDNDDVQTWGPIVAAFLTAVSVYVVPNGDPMGTHQAESVQPPERGASDLVTIAAVLVIIVAVVFLVRFLA